MPYSSFLLIRLVGTAKLDAEEYASIAVAHDAYIVMLVASSSRLSSWLMAFSLNDRSAIM